MSFVVHRVSKSAARYTDAGGREKCGYCRFFVAPRSCGKVVGPVSPAGWCKYFSRQIAQQYSGAGITGGGGPPGMTLDLNFMSSGNMPAGVTFTRASTATYTDSTGTIQTAAVDQPRWDYAGGSLRGLLIEEARTNTFLWSADAGNAWWGKVSAVVAAPVVTANSAVAPDGTTTAARVVMPAVSGATANCLVNTPNPTVSAGANYCASWWLRGAVGGERLVLATTADGSNFLNTQITLTTNWQRYTLSTNLSAGSWYYEYGVDLRIAGQTPTPAQTFYVWGAQNEAGGFPTSYIPTTSAAATRALDTASMTTAGWYNAAAGSMMGEALFPVPATSNGQQAIFSLNDGSFNNRLEITRDPTANTLQAVGLVGGSTTAFGAVGSVIVGGTTKAVTAVSTGSQRGAVNGGVPVVTGASAALPVINNLSIGSLLSSTYPLNGYIRRIQYWPRALTNAEMQQVTT